MQKWIDNYIAKAERILNPIDWVPLISSYSGMIRILSGLVETVASAIFTYIKMVHALLTTAKGEIGSALRDGLIYFTHGIVNIGRGACAMIPGINLLLCVYDNKICARFNYPKEIVPIGVYPLATAKRLAHYY